MIWKLTAPVDSVWGVLLIPVDKVFVERIFCGFLETDSRGHREVEVTLVNGVAGNRLGIDPAGRFC